MDDIVDKLRQLGRTTGSAVPDAAADKIERLLAERLKLDRRIHNQRVSNRITWEIVEMRRKWLGSDTARRLYINLRIRYNKLQEQLRSGALG